MTRTMMRTRSTTSSVSARSVPGSGELEKSPQSRLRLVKVRETKFSPLLSIETSFLSSSLSFVLYCMHRDGRFVMGVGGTPRGAATQKTNRYNTADFVLLLPGFYTVLST